MPTIRCEWYCTPCPRPLFLTLRSRCRSSVPASPRTRWSTQRQSRRRSNEHLQRWQTPSRAVRNPVRVFRSSHEHVIRVTPLAIALSHGLVIRADAADVTRTPENVVVQSGELKLHALVFHPPGEGPFPAV